MKKTNQIRLFAALENIFAWCWMLCALYSVYCLFLVFSSDGEWWQFIKFSIFSIVGSWLSGGFKENKIRVIQENNYKEQGDE